MSQQLTLFSLDNDPDIESSVIVSVSGRKRIRFSFWLEVDKPFQLELAKTLFHLKRLRDFAPTLRAALSLYFDLQSGRTDELERLFPFAVQSSVIDLEPLQSQLERLERRILAGSSVVSVPNALPSQRSSSVDFEEDERMQLTIEESKTQEIVGWNLQLSMAKNGIGHTYMQLPLEALEYGLKRGGLGVTPEIVAQKRALLAQCFDDTAPTIPIKVPSDGEAKAMDVPQFDSPLFDDDDLDGLLDVA